MGLAVLAFRLPFSTASALEMEGLLRALVDGDKGRDVLGRGAGPRSSVSETNRRPIGSVLETVGAFSRLGRPRAAAAPIESKVVREARSAASWSAA